MNAIQNKTAMVNTPVHLVKNALNAWITVFENNEDRGFVVLESNILEVTGFGQLNNKKRTAIINGDVEDLKKLIRLKGTDDWGGRIAIIEYTENNVPDAFKSKFSYKDSTGQMVDAEEGMIKYLKKSSKDGVVLTKDGQRIVKFNIYDPTGTTEDLLVKHDNTDEVMNDRHLRNVSSTSKKNNSLPE
jgi:hypothetical protein